jgi:beta-lactamase regulating signal transducer with metallopeptidase domain
MRHWPFWIERVGWTLVHSVWQLAVVALLAALGDAALRRHSAGVRYVATALALGIMLFLPGLTFIGIDVEPPAELATSQPIAAPVTPGSRPTAGLDGPAGDAGREHRAANRFSVVPGPGSQPGEPHRATGDVPRQGSAARKPALPRPRPSRGWPRLEGFSAAVEPKLPWLVAFWLLGVVLCSTRPICGIWFQWHLRRCGLSPVPEVVTQTLAGLVRRMGITRAVQIVQSSLVSVPLVAGYLRPLILLPACVVTGMTPEQLEAVLAHELAHVRRHDYLINALQVLAETVLYYHPAVWWISRRLRHARELCCDDLALRFIDDKATFARALLRLEELRQTVPGPRLAAVSLAATGGRLSDRIRRLLPVGGAREQTARSSLAGTILLVTVVLAGGLSLFAMPLTGTGQGELATAGAAPKKTEQPAAANAAGNKDVADPPPDTTPNVRTAEVGGAAQNAADSPQRAVTVVDENEQPVAGATVQFQFMVSATDHAFLSDPVQTDNHGAARVAIPNSADRVWISVTAPGFGESTAQESASGSSTIALKRGRRIRVRAVDGQKRVLNDAVPLLAGSRIWGREFKLTDNGVYQSPDVALARKWLRVACAQQKGPMLFSDPIDVSTAAPGKDGVHELTLRPGIRLEGRLDDSVPRPITEGYVELIIVEGEQGKLRYEGWDWHDFAAVRPDGTFTFESLPGGGHAQLHVLVDGSIAKNRTRDELVAYLRNHKLVDEEQIEKVREQLEHRAMWPHLVPLDRAQVAITIPCEPAAACDFLLLDPAGKPASDATVCFSPNGVFLYGGLFIPGWESSQALLVDGLRTGDLNGTLDGDLPTPHGREARRRTEWAKRWFLFAQPDAEGRVRIRNLPGGVRESFRVESKEWVLPVSPLLDDRHLGNPDFAEDRNRFGLVDLVSGATIEKTINLERAQPVVDRELIVVNRAGKPLSSVSLGVAEIRVGAKQWQTWSTNRFGARPRGTTDGLGRLTLRVPSVVDGTAVERVRLGVNYSPERNPQRTGNQDRAEDLFVRSSLVEVPLARDDGVIVLLPDPDRPNTESTTYPGIVRYGRLEDILPKRTPADWLAMMIKQPNLAVLRKLLAGANVKHPHPVELLDDRRREAERPGEKTSRVQVVSDGADEYAIVEARVRPLSGVRDNENDPQNLPECAYVFDRQGSLLAALGGEVGATGAGDPDEVDLINLGPREDWFVRVTRFEQKGPFEFQSTYYRLGQPIVNSLQYFHYANSNSWSAGPEQIVRFGHLEFDFPEVRNQLGFKGLGTTADGAKVVPTLVWDGDGNRFVGAAAQRVNTRPLYEVDTTWSKEFVALSPRANQLVIEGGERDYDHWFLWEMAVPEASAAVVTLRFPRRANPRDLVETIERTLSPGRQLVQFQLKPVRDGAAAKLKLSISDPKQPGGKEKLDFDLPFKVGDRPPIHPPITQQLDPQETARVLSRSLTDSTEDLSIDIKLLAR